MVIQPGKRNFFSYQLHPYTVYYLEPGVHVGFIMADTRDAFVGGYYRGKTSIMSGEDEGLRWAIDSNTTDGNQKGVTIEYLTVEKYRPYTAGGALNQDANTGWAIKNDLITLNAPGAGAILGSNNLLQNSCLTLNGQYGFQSVNSDPWGSDSLTSGPFDITVKGDEISYNDTCDYEGLAVNPADGGRKYNPVPAKYRNSYCGTVVPNGDQGGFKLWRTNNVTIENNYIHNNWGPGAWADTDNANTNYVGNTFVHNDNAAIIEEISYNFSITDNYMADNDWIGGLGNPGFPQPAIYVSESGSDSRFGGVPGRYSKKSVISGNTLVNNGGSVFLWQNSNRYCSDSWDSVCTLVDGAGNGPFTRSGCTKNLPTAALKTSTFVGAVTGSPAEDWWDGCMWRTENVEITKNVIDFNPAVIPDCNKKYWSDCGAGGVFSEYGSPPNAEPGWVVPSDITFFQHNLWSNNVYKGPSIFVAWNQGSGDNPVSWAEWTGPLSKGDECGSAGDRSSGFCTGPFGQDKGSTYTSKPLTNPPTAVAS